MNVLKWCVLGTKLL